MTPPQDAQKGAVAPMRLQVLVETKDFKKVYAADNGFQAVRMFFKEIAEGQIPLSDVGLIGFWNRADGEKIPFRITPALYEAGLISKETLLESITKGIGVFDAFEIMKMVVNDSWMVEGLEKDRYAPTKAKLE